MKFLEGLDNDIKISLLKQIRDLWTHTSTAIEGNTLTLGETAFVIEEGLTIKGKPLRDHNEVRGHARAIEIIYRLMEKTRIDTEDVFDLHTAVQVEDVLDVLRPAGKWKTEPNGTYAVIDEKQVFIEYAAPQDVPALMERWIGLFNEAISRPPSDGECHISYAKLHVSFVQIHPFSDGNGRMARLLANGPVIKAGYPPIVIPVEERQTYISLLASYRAGTGSLTARDIKLVAEESEAFGKFAEFCAVCRDSLMELVKRAREVQGERNAYRMDRPGK